ncbi:MAG: DUF1456 family protein [Flavobacterium sp.]|nr:MAG: DUF1456 family protein [Flavobacterium sp.]
MNNNDIFKKLRVALQLRDDQIVEILELVDFRLSKAELGAFFRATDHPNYMECGDQVLRNFLNGLIIHLRGTKEEPKNAMDVIDANRAALKETTEKQHSERIASENKPAGKPKLVVKSPAKNTNAKLGNKSKSKPKKPEPVVEKVKYNNGKNKKG